MPQTDLIDSLDEELMDLSSWIAPRKSWVSRSRTVCNKVFKILKRNSKYSIDRCRYVGGIEKNTSTRLNFDMDLAIYCNNIISREGVLAEWKSLLIDKTHLEDEDIRHTTFLLSFKYMGVHIDIIPIHNRRFKSLSTEYKDVELQQLEEDLRITHLSHDPVKASEDLTLSIQSVKWMQSFGPDVSKFIADLARLAKFWSQSIFFPRKVWGMSYIFELLAAEAALEVTASSNANGEFNNQYPPLFRGLQRFLTLVSTMPTLRILFLRNNSFVDASNIPTKIRQQTPLLINPVNPFQNMLDIWEPVKEDFFNTFTSQATEAIVRLTEILMTDTSFGSDQRQALSTIFSPKTVQNTFKGYNYLPKDIIICLSVEDEDSGEDDQADYAYDYNYDYEDDSSCGEDDVDNFFPKLIVNNDHKQTRGLYRKKRFGHTILTNVAAQVCLFEWMFPWDNEKWIQNGLKDILFKICGKKPQIKENGTDRKVRPFTMKVPTLSSGDVEFSMGL